MYTKSRGTEKTQQVHKNTFMRMPRRTYIVLKRMFAHGHTSDIFTAQRAYKPSETNIPSQMLMISGNRSEVRGRVTWDGSHKEGVR